MPEPARLHLGCGLKTPPGWIHVDGSWNARLARHPLFRSALKALRLTPPSLLAVPWSREVQTHDLRSPLPWTDCSISIIYSSHTLEHLYLVEARRLLRDCFRVLVPGGVLRVVVPDLREFVRCYLEPRSESFDVTAGILSPADLLCQKLQFHTPQPPSGKLPFRLFKALNDLQLHRWMYDAESLIRHFEWAGFEEVSEMALHESRIGRIREIEDPDRVLHGAGICVEGVRPPEGPG